ncbi:hypothetical protein M885DRAFT_616601 [Pelagophyceae sp. CCMP2097]|nr:hypothetical protein M885DRAFT_616601 [Pelagophyceae sp. CCMP2097]
MAALASGDADADWVAAHSAQLLSIELPQGLWAVVARKLREQRYDAGAAVAFAPREDGAWAVEATVDVAADAEVWLCDHVWMIQSLLKGRAELAAVPELRQRLRMLLAAADADEAAMDDEATGAFEAADDLLRLVALHAHPMRFASCAGGESTGVVYYVMDEVGSRIDRIAIGNQVVDAEDVEGEKQMVNAAACPSLDLIEDGQVYWKRRFDSEKVFDWYCPWSAIEKDVLALADAFTDANVLVAGNGNSPLPVQLEAVRPLLKVIAVDYVQEVTRRMRSTHASSGVEWVDGDLTMPFTNFLGTRNCQVIVDKGGLDALLIKPTNERLHDADTWITDSSKAASAVSYLTHARRALDAQGRMLLVTLGSLENRQPLFDRAGLAVERWARVSPTASMLRGEHNDAGATVLNLAVLRPAAEKNAQVY